MSARRRPSVLPDQRPLLAASLPDALNTTISRVSLCRRGVVIAGCAGFTATRGLWVSSHVQLAAAFPRSPRRVEPVAIRQKIAGAANWG